MKYWLYGRMAGKEEFTHMVSSDSMEYIDGVGEGLQWFVKIDLQLYENGKLYSVRNYGERVWRIVE